MRQGTEQSHLLDWKQLYLAAIFENNKSRIPDKIAEAQRVLAMTRFELLNRPAGDAKEIQALDNALFSLNALRSCLVVSASAAA